MSLVDIEMKYYSCPHCEGYIAVRVQHYYEGGMSQTAQHIDKDGNEKELEKRTKLGEVSRER